MQTNDKPDPMEEIEISDSLAEQVLELGMAIQQIPAPTFDEGQRAEFIRQRFQAEGLENVTIDAVGNVFGRLPGGGATYPVIVSAHLDTVFPASTNLQVVRETGRVYGAGIGDNSIGVAGLFGLLWGLRQRMATKAIGTPPGDLWLVANVCEEGLGNLRGMRAVVDRFGKDVLAYVVLEGMGLGEVYHRGLGVQRYRISVQTKGGHSWVDYGEPSAIHELAGLITRLVSIPLPATPRTTMNVGIISGGTSINTIAGEAHLELDLRSEDPKVLQDLVRQVEQLVQETERGDEIISKMEVIGQRPAGKISGRHALVQLTKQRLSARGIDTNLSIGSTDANEPLSRGIPAVCVGVTTGDFSHTVKEYINISPLQTGLGFLVSLVEGIFFEI